MRGLKLHIHPSRWYLLPAHSYIGSGYEAHAWLCFTVVTTDCTGAGWL